MSHVARGWRRVRQRDGRRQGAPCGADELGDAMDARCYTGGKKRTKYKKLRFSWRDGIAFFLGAVLIAGVVLMGIYLRAPL